jgi:acetyl-CoA synthetase
MGKFVWKPTKDYIQRTNIKRFMDKYAISNYDELIQRSTEDLSWFWDAVMKDLDIRWYQPYTTIYDDSKGIQWTKWFIDGKTNIVLNCIDKHVASKNKHNVALIWENEAGAVRKLTFEEL